MVFLSPAEPGLYVVKRVIGVPGDRIHLRNGVVFRNGEKLDEPYVIHDSDEGPNDYRDNFPPCRPPITTACFRTGRNVCRNISKAMTWSCLPTAISPWATIAT